MRAPYDLKSQYWPLEEQEVQYRNSKPFLISPKIALSPPTDQLVITQYPHDMSYRFGARPRLIPVQYSFNNNFLEKS